MCFMKKTTVKTSQKQFRIHTAAIYKQLFMVTAYMYTKMFVEVFNSDPFS